MLQVALHWQIFIALIAGAATGFFFGSTIAPLAFAGTLFLKALKMIIVPLIATSMYNRDRRRWAHQGHRSRSYGPKDPLAII
ncbi:MAG TPA: cation:dicarboxylase symporter family transporter [Candidatus Latescibacteria bacterium]|nr:cation:dicarboxylase symporter family transporter [Candidatus Latescibacterota bacterium]